MRCLICGDEIKKGVENVNQAKKRRYCSNQCKAQRLTPFIPSQEEIAKMAEKARNDAIAKRRNKSY